MPRFVMSLKSRYVTLQVHVVMPHETIHMNLKRKKVIEPINHVHLKSQAGERTANEHSFRPSFPK